MGGRDGVEGAVGVFGAATGVFGAAIGALGAATGASGAPASGTVGTVVGREGTLGGVAEGGITGGGITEGSVTGTRPGSPAASDKILGASVGRTLPVGSNLGGSTLGVPGVGIGKVEIGFATGREGIMLAGEGITPAGGTGIGRVALFPGTIESPRGAPAVASDSERATSAMLRS